jgi:hypothetical protein
MNDQQRDVIEMAREAGLGFFRTRESDNTSVDALKRFVAIVREEEGKRLLWACEQARNHNETFEYLIGFDRCTSVLNAERIEL